jgi:hypothetical protein
MFQDEAAHEALAAIPVETDAQYEVPFEDGGSYKEILKDEFVRSALEDDVVRLAVIDEDVRTLLAEDWIKSSLTNDEVRGWLKGAAESSRDVEDVRSENAGRDEFKAEGEGGERFKAISEDFDEFKAVSDDAAEFKAALESNPTLKKAVFEHIEVFNRAAYEPEFQKALQRSVADFQKMEELFGKAVIGNRTLAFALAENPDSFMKAVQLAKIPELQKMDEGMRRAILTNKSVQEAVLARTVEFEKANQGY